MVLEPNSLVKFIFKQVCHLFSFVKLQENYNKHTRNLNIVQFECLRWPIVLYLSEKNNLKNANLQKVITLNPVNFL